MKKTAKYLLGFLMFVFFCTIGFAGRPVSVSAEDIRVVLDNGLVAEYMKNSADPEVSIVGYQGSLGDVVIPEKVDGHWVTTIYRSAFEGNKVIESVSIPESVRLIEKKAFKNCPNLKTVILEGDHRQWSKVNKNKTAEPVSIREEAFNGCTSLEYFEGIFLNTYAEPKEIFAGSGLKSVLIKYDGWTHIDKMFNGCTELETINIDISTANASCNLSMQTWKDMPKLKTVNIYNAEKCNVGTGLNYAYFTPFENCPRFEAVNVYFNEPAKKRFDFGLYAALVSSNPDLVKLTGLSSTSKGQEMDYGGSVSSMNGNGQAVIRSEHNIIPFEFRVFVGDRNAKKNLSDAVCVLPVSSFTYNGYELEPYTEVTYEGELLTRDVDYTVSHKDNKEIGTATITLEGKGDYTGKISTSFKIVPQTTVISNISKSGKKYTVSWSSYIKNCGYELSYSKKKSSGYKKLAATTKTSTSSDTLKKGMYIKVRTYVTVSGKKYYSEYSKPIQIK